MPSLRQTTIARPAVDKGSAAEVDINETRHDFGQMDPYTEGAHKFTLRNAGQKPLILRLGQISCKCTASSLPRGPIAPGESAEIAVQWQTAKNNRFFQESVTILTNDPSTPEIRLTVEGKVRVHFGADPPKLHIPTARPGVRESVSTLLSSQVWPDFRVVDVTSSLKELTWSTSPPGEAELQRMLVAKGIELTVTLPLTMPTGPFTHWIRVKVEPRPGEEVQEYELPLTGKVVRRVAVYGAGIDAEGNIQFGIVRSREGQRRRFIVKVRDDEPGLKIENISTAPAFVVATLQPATVLGAKGLYHLDLEIPKGTRPCNFINEERGKVRIDFDHPRIDSLELSLEFAVVDSGPRR
jgi:hypothetical protein